jgi:hypothetical protein
MPCGDGTGPMGQGPGTGRQAGNCVAEGVPGYVDPAFRRGSGRGCGRGRWQGAGFGRGGGRGWRHRGEKACRLGSDAGPAADELTPEQEVEMLKQRAEHLKNVDENIRERIQELETAQKEA